MNWWKKNIQPYLVKTSVVTLLTFLLTWSVLPTLLDFSAVMSLQDADSFRMSDFYNRVAAHSADKYASDRLLCLTYDGFSRDTIAQVLEKIAACCQPAAVGVDFHFLLPQDNDARLVAAMQALHDRLVLPVTVAGNDSDGYVLRGKPCFADSLPEVRFGAVNLAGNYFLDVIRDFPPFFVAEGDTCRNIAVELAWLADPVTTERFLEANKDRELITPYPILFCSQTPSAPPPSSVKRKTGAHGSTAERFSSGR
ncbi:MAG: CHASE2 domain-containing protein [Paludibacteraceae bacterium]|nr:CHASE2 domain-containing protein [Paludibacteraceae bacterium]